jgi:ABC-type nitrate/sulfonate/bicarbonate transport system permease component
VRRLRRLGLEALLPAAVLVAWGAWSAGAHSFFFPPLLDILGTFRETWLSGRFGSDAVPSLERVAAGYGLALLAGIGAGLLIGSSRPVRQLCDPVIEFLRALPPPVLIPFAILVFGIGPSMKVFVIAVGCVWPILLNTVDGVRGLDPALLETARVYGVRRRDRLWAIVLPAASPRIFAGLRSALSLALILMVISEMEASTNGIGFGILQAQRSFAIPEMWSGILLLGLVGYAVNGAFALVERRALRWHRASLRSALGPPDAEPEAAAA